jgi:hypothetical protein
MQYTRLRKGVTLDAGYQMGLFGVLRGVGMEERDFFDERPEQRKHVMTCPHCGQQGEYEIQWIVRRKKAQLPRGADDRDKARFAKAQSYMVRRDDPMGCKNIRCRKRFDVTGIQSVAFI